MVVHCTVLCMGVFYLRGLFLSGLFFYVRAHMASSWKTSVLFFILTAAGWIGFIIGFGMRTNWNSGEIDREKGELYFLWWTLACSGPLVLLGLLFYHKVKSPPYRAVVAFLLVVSLVAGGAILNENFGIVYKGGYYEDYVLVEAIGASHYVLFQAFHLPYLFLRAYKRKRDHMAVNL
ncbi:uncharacterized protein [Oscarella lobularis]|uniref:uncharacterized protein n=1 Tax=Oscarella lobularis TaxID=121494 RepID=UPI003314126A